MFGIAAAIAFATVALARVAYGMFPTFNPTIGTDQLLLFAFAAVIIGGLGSLWETLAGGIMVAAVGCGPAGGLLIISQLNVEPSSAFSVQWSAEMIFATLIGGIGTIEGPIVGTVVFFVLQQNLSQYNAWYLITWGWWPSPSPCGRRAGSGGPSPITPTSGCSRRATGSGPPAKTGPGGIARPGGWAAAAAAATAGRVTWRAGLTRPVAAGRARPRRAAPGRIRRADRTRARRAWLAGGRKPGPRALHDTRARHSRVAGLPGRPAGGE